MMPINQNHDDENDDDEKKSHLLDEALRKVSELEDEYLTVVPREPTTAMLKTAALVAGVSLETARLVYKAMLWAAAGEEGLPPREE